MNQEPTPHAKPSKVSDLRRLVPLMLIALTLVVPYFSGGKELIALPIMLTLLVVSALMILSERSQRTTPPLILVWLLLAGSVVLSSIITPRVTSIIGELLLVGGFGLAMWVVIQLTDLEAARVRMGMVLSGVVLAIIGMIGLFSQSTAYGTLISTFYNSNAIAGYLVILSGIAIAAAVSGTNRTSRLLYGASTALFLYAIYLTQSRGAWFGLAAGVILLTAVLVRRKRDKPWTRKSVVAAFVVAVALVGVTAAVSLGTQSINQKLTTFVEGEPRFDYWAASMQLGAISPVLGGGVGTFEYEYPDVQTSVLSFSRVPHSKLFKSFAEGGVVGLVVFIFFSIVSIWVGWMACLKASREQLPIYLGGLVGFSAFLIHGVIDFQWFFPATAVLGFMALGLSGRGLSRESVYGKGHKAGIAAAIAILLVVGVLHYQSATAAESAGLKAGLGDLDAAEDSLDLASVLDPTASLPHLYMGLNHMARVGKDDEDEKDRYLELARQEIAKAINLDQLNPQNYSALGRVELMAATIADNAGSKQSALERAVSAFEAAYEMDTWNRPEISIQLADAAEEAGNLELTQRVLRETIDKYPVETTQALRGWFSGGMSVTEVDELMEDRPDIEELLGKYYQMVKALSRSHYRLARLALEAGDTQSAIEGATRALEIDETNHQARGLLEKLEVEPQGD